MRKVGTKVGISTIKTKELSLMVLKKLNISPKGAFNFNRPKRISCTPLNNKNNCQNQSFNFSPGLIFFYTLFYCAVTKTKKLYDLLLMAGIYIESNQVKISFSPNRLREKFGICSKSRSRKHKFN